MSNVVVVGTQWGDEGKGKITDILAKTAKGVVRSQGGANAGHTIIFSSHEYRLHLVPSGIFYPNVTCYIAAGVVADLHSLKKEIEQVTQAGIAIENRLWISSRAQVVLPHHKYIDAMQEKLKGSQGVGTTGKGIGPCYGDKIGRIGLRMADMVDSVKARKHLSSLWDLLQQLSPFLQNYKEQWFAECEELLALMQEFRPFIRDDFEFILHKAVEQGDVVFEGAQGSLLDISFGSYPYVTSSSTISSGIVNGAGVPNHSIDHVLGIMKAYTTRVGGGSLPTTMTEKEEKSFDHHAVREIGTTTGRKRRIGWLDGVVARYSNMINGVDSLAITKLDVLDDLASIKVAVAYRMGNKTLEYPPVCAEDWNGIEPVYEEMPGWQCSTKNFRNFNDLPENAKRYIHWIEKWCKVPVSIVSVGPDRDQTIIRHKIL